MPEQNIETYNGFVDFLKGSNISGSVIAIILFFVLKKIVFRIFENNIHDSAKLHSAKHLTNFLSTGVLLLFLIHIWTKNAQSLLPYLSIFSAGLAIAMHDTISNLTGWLFIVWKKPISPGDRVQVDNNIGDIIDISALFFTMLEVGGERIGAEQSTGRIIHIPNGKILRNEIINYNEGFNYIWHEIELTLTFESNWQNAKNILEEIVNELTGQFPEAARQAVKKASKKFYIKQGKLTPIIYTNVVDCGVKMTVRFIIDPRQIRGVESKMWETILMRFKAENDIDLAYPTTRFYQTQEK